MKYLIALTVCICISAGLAENIPGYAVHRYPVKFQIQPNWQLSKPNSYSVSTLLATKYLDDMIAANIESLLNPNSNLIRRERSKVEEVEPEVTPKPRHHKVKGSFSLQQKSKTLKPVEQDEDASPEGSVVYREHPRYSPFSSHTKRSSGTRATVDKLTKKVETKEPVVDLNARQVQDHEILQAYNLLYRLLQADPLLGMAYNSWAGAIPSGLSTGSLDKNNGGTQTNLGEGIKTEPMEQKAKKSSNSEKEQFEKTEPISDEATNAESEKTNVQQN